MKVLFVIDNLGSGGAQRQMVNLALGFAKRGHLVEFFIYYPQYDFFEPILCAENITVHKRAKRNRFDLSSIFTIRRLIAKEHYDIILSFLDTPNFYSEIATIGLTYPILIVSERISYSSSGPSFSKKLIEQFHRLSQGVVVNSYHQGEQMARFSPWMRTKLHVIYNGLDLTTYAYQPESMRKKNTLLAVGSIIPRKNIVNLAKALVEYKNIYGNPPKLAWAGVIQPLDVSQEIYEVTNRILKANNLDRNWEWLGEQKNMYKLYPQYSALIHPSFLEGLPNAVCEAMACGLPVLLSDSGEHKRLVNNRINGILFNPNSPHDIARAIYEFIQMSEGEQKEMSIASREFAESQFSLEAAINNYHNLFVSLINNNRIVLKGR